MNARELAFAIDPNARRYGKHWRVRCVAHDDRHASLDIRDGDNGKPLLFCRAGCGLEVLATLRSRRLWRPERETEFQSHRFSWPPHCAARPATVKPHAPMGREYELAFLRGQLDRAAFEIRALYRVGKERLGATDIERELGLALELGGIDLGGLPAVVVEDMIQNFCGGGWADDGISDRN
jgi:hypothetical protein